MDFFDENLIEILKNTTRPRESIIDLPFEIVLDDERNYQNDERLLFMGDHSKLKKLVNKDGKCEYAMKIIKINKIQKGHHEYFELIQNEIKFLRKLDHPNVILMKEYFKDKKYFYIIYELAEYGNLLDYYRKTERFTEDDVFQFFFQILLAVDFIHKKGIVHRNLKLQNLLMDAYHNLKLSNFKYACEEDNPTKLSKFIKNLPYCPPEVLLNSATEQKFDIWGLGIILYELLSKTSAFNGIIIEHTIHNIMNSSSLIKGHLSPPLRNLLSTLLAKDPIERPTTEKILRHEWILHNLPKYDISFLKHPAFRNFHNIHDLMRFSTHDISPSLKHFPDIRKTTFFGRVNSKHQIFLLKNQEGESGKLPNIFHDGYFEKSYSPHSVHSLNKSIQKSQADIKSQSHLSPSPSSLNRIFGPMRAHFKNSDLKDDDYEMIQHVRDRVSLGQEEQGFSHPVEIEKKKKTGFTTNNLAHSQKLYKSNDFYDKNYNQEEHSQVYNNKLSNFFIPKEENPHNTSTHNMNRMITGDGRSQNDYSGMSGYSNRSNNQGLYFDRGQKTNNRNFFV